MKKLLISILLFSFFWACKKQPGNSNNSDNVLGFKSATEAELQNIGNAPMLLSGVLPGSFSLNMPTAGAQGNQPSCCSWTVAYALGSYYMNIKNTSPYFDNSMLASPSYIYNQITHGNCNPTTFPENLNILLNKGVCTLKDMPYDENNCSGQPNAAQHTSASLHKIIKWNTIDKKNLANIKSLLFSGYPILIAINIDDNFDNLNNNPPYILKNAQLQNRGGHAVTVVGWDDNRNAFKVLNSWGKSWCDNGYFWMDYNYFKNDVLECYVAYPSINKSSIVDIVSCGTESSFAIKSDGTLWGWGRNTDGQIGDGTIIHKYRATLIASGKKWIQVASSKLFTTLAIRTDGTLWAWGDNVYGQYGNGSTSSTINPQQIGTENNWKQISCGTYHCCALKNDGTLWSWGGNSSGQIGDATNTGKSSPAQITSFLWIDISCGNYHTLAIKSDGTLWAWGRNASGEIGNGTTTNSNIPVLISNSTDWKHVIASNGYSFAIKQDGTLWGWGYNLNGVLGDGSTVSKLVPTKIGNDTWKQIGVGEQSTIGIKSNGTLWAWGKNDYGQLGDGTTISKINPVQIGNVINTWESISCGLAHSIARKNDGTLWAWGSNFDGELGNGTTNSSYIPIQVN